MLVESRGSCKKTWQTGRQRVSVDAALAIQRENVVQRLVRLREEVGHPEKAGEPLPQDQAAQKAGVTARQWQRWESGASVPYARNLAAVADAFEFDVGEFYDGPAGKEPAPTPDPFPAVDDADDRLSRIEQAIADARAERDEQARVVSELLETQNALLARQSAILERIEVATKRVDEASRSFADSAAQAGQALRSETRRQTQAASMLSPRRIRRASKPAPG